MNTYSASQLMAQNLAAKATAMKSFKQQNALMISVEMHAHADTVPDNIRAKLLAAIGNGKDKAHRQMRSEANLSKISLGQQISVLRDAPLNEKHYLLDSLPIIPVPIGAAFLGVAEDDLHDINSDSYGVFGDVYLRRRCNSMNELLLIAQNPGFLRFRPDGAPPLTLPNSKMLYGMTFVDISTAMAYTNMGLHELQMKAQQIYRFYRCNFTYRVSDLADIRIAKLKAQQK